MHRQLVSVREPAEAGAAAQGGAHIIDVEYPASALGTPYPFNIRAVRQRLDEARFEDTPISTNIGAEQPVRSTACQAALGVAGREYQERRAFGPLGNGFGRGLRQGGCVYRRRRLRSPRLDRTTHCC